MTDRDEVERLAVEVGKGFARVTKNHPNGDFVRFTDYEALRQRAEAARRRCDTLEEGWRIADDDRIEAETALTEARAQVAAAWEAAAQASRKWWDDTDTAAQNLQQYILAATPADASAALQARLDAEWNAAIEAMTSYHESKRDALKAEADIHRGRDDEAACEALAEAISHGDAIKHIRALRRSGKGE